MEENGAPSAPTEAMPEGFLALGQVLGDRYQITSQLGRGGMGEVWRAFDLKLRVEVALKALREDLFKDEKRLELLRREVRAAREVVSPNVCRIFDLIEVGDRELVSMEYVDGGTLLEVLQERGPLDLKEAQDIASQFLAGLEAIHQAGLVHRDVKPENIMITRAGRVVLMDFGLAKQEDSGAGTVSGTPAYMAPEQAAGLKVDARADVYSAGVVLAEMVSPEGIKSFESRQSVWEGIRREPSRVPDTPWAPVLKKAVAKEPDQRYKSAHTLTRALEDVTLRVEGAEDLHPYPGLASFTEEDAEYFFGREAEIEAMWAKLEGPARLFAIMGPSGAGKTSFIRAGLVAHAPPGWAIIRSTPGNAAVPSLAGVVARETAGDPDAVELLPRFDNPDVAVRVLAAWASKNHRSLLVIDQFEELFTQNPVEEQKRFADLLRRFVLESNIHVLLSMRDDFAASCNAFESLRPIFHEITVLDPPVGANLRRAVVQPAQKCGYRFEDDELVGEMLDEVEGERGALPMLAFAVARLWDRRYRGDGLLTRLAYRDIGGVGGALARHAEATIERIGTDRVAIVRELFRNLVTAEGTRTVLEWDELLSVFPNDQHEPADQVLRELIDARLLTAYEVKEEDREPTRRVEIIHESLLANWPRLVRWQTQDQEGAQLRDELRQAARTWNEHGRSDDLLWTGSAYREFQVWRERYPGGQTESEEAFGEAMTRHAGRRRRRRRAVVAVTFLFLLGVLAVIGGFWRRSVSEARRAEAANLFALGQLQLEDYPSATVAYAVASLEFVDSPEVRRLALDALWRGPTEIRLETQSPYSLSFGPDGRWLATADPDGGHTLWPSDGGPPTALEGSEIGMGVRISPRGDLVAGMMDAERRELGLWSFPKGRFLRSFSLGDLGRTFFFPFSRDGERLFTSTEIMDGERSRHEFRSWRVEGGEPDLLALLDLPISSDGTGSGVAPTGSRLCWADGRKVRIARLEGTTPLLASATSVEHERTIAALTIDERGRQLATSDTGGEIRIWSLVRDPPELMHTIRGPGGPDAGGILFDPSGSMLANLGGFLWDLTASPDAEPLRLRDPGIFSHGLTFDAKSNWLATALYPRSVCLWSLAHAFPQVLRGHEEMLIDVAFSPDGRRLVSAAEDGSVRVWPLGGSSGERSRILHQAEGVYGVAWRLAMAPDGSFAATGSKQGNVRVIPLAGGPVRELAGFTDVISGLAVGPQARLVAAGGGGSIRKEAVVRVWDLESKEVRILDAGDDEAISRLEFSDDGDLWVKSGPKLRRWRLDGSTPRVLEEFDFSESRYVGDGLHDFDPDARQVLLCDRGTPRGNRKPWVQNLDTLESRELSSHGPHYWWCRLYHADGEIVISIDERGGILVGPATGEEPHLLLGHEGPVAHVAVSPDGRWIATGGVDKTIRLWPMPDLSKPPLHTLPRNELIAKLKTLTNLRAVPDETSPTGWKIEAGPFPGWETVPSW